MMRTITKNDRPSKREIDNRLKEAREALQCGRGFFANEPKIVGELMALQIEDTSRVWDLILELLEELTLDDYTGGHPPQRSYEPSIAECELWAFVWHSVCLGKKMYLKFAVKNGCFYYVSLHESKFPRRE